MEGAVRYPKRTPWERLPKRWQEEAIAHLESAAAEAAAEIAYYERTLPDRSDRPLSWISDARCRARAYRAAARKLRREL
jgi:hypothetical protein